MSRPIVVALHDVGSNARDLAAATAMATRTAMPVIT
jgi:hypothetical protein